MTIGIYLINNKTFVKNRELWRVDLKKSVLFFAFLIALLISCENMAGGGGSDSEPKSPSVPQNPVITVSAPVFSVISGDVSSGTQVSVSCSTDGATIYYTTDGSVPTSASLIYTSPFTINSAIQIKAVGIKTGFADSSISSATYTLEGVIAPPRIDPAGGAVNREQKISLFNFYSYDDVEIFYTTDGSVPDIGSAAYAGTPLSVETSPVNFKAVAIRKSDGLKSVVSAETYKIKVQAPVFSIQGGKVSIGTTVNLSGGNIHYTTDGSEPNSSSPLYSTGIRIDTVTTIKAICISSDSNYANSDVVENTYSPTAFYVCDTGSDSEGTGSVSKPYATLQKAVDVIKSSGTGYEYSVRLMSDVTMPTGLAVNLPQGLNLIIESDSNTMRTIDGNHSDDTCLNFTGSGNLKIKNIKINDYKGAVYASGSGNLIIDHVTARVFRVPSYDGNDGGDGGIAFNLSGGDTKI